MLWVVLGLLVLVVLVAVSLYNKLVALKVQADSAWSDIDTQLKRRHDLIPNLVETVKGYAAHEKGVFEKVTEARSRAMAAQTPAQVSQAEGMLTTALRGLYAVAENYPELRATENFQQLSRNLSELEDEIQAARRIYNSNVQSYNTKIQVFPNSIVAGVRNFEAREFFEVADAADREPVQVSFN